VKILAVSDKIIPVIYSAAAREQFSDVSLVIGCGDLPYYYLEFILTVLDKPLFFVRGNHAHQVEYGSSGPRRSPWGAVDLHRRTHVWNKLLFAGFEGSRRYNRGSYQYTDREMWLQVWGLVPHLIMNKLIYGRYLDVLVTHSPPYQIGDADDPAHIGFRAFRWLLRWFKPRLMLHGHIHLYHPKTPWRGHFVETEIINCYGYRVLDLTEFGLVRDNPVKDPKDAGTTSRARLRSSDAQGVLEPDQELGDAT
jgi:hypothetical protein